MPRPLEIITDRILNAIRQAPDCTLEELMSKCPDLTWGQLFLELNRLHRTGALKLTSKAMGSFTVSLQTREHDRDLPTEAAC
jgi:hypothetical protein